MNLVENKHYEIIPDKTDDKAWNVRVLSGPYTETVIKYGVVKFNGEDKDMTFNFDIIYMKCEKWFSHIGVHTERVGIVLLKRKLGEII